MPTHKTLIIKNLLQQLQYLYQSARQAAEDARELATHEQSKPETQYDTVGLEASYLAHGQSMRAAELQQAIQYWQKHLHSTQTDHQCVTSGCLVAVENEDGLTQTYLLGDFAGGFKVELNASLTTVITPQAPLGAALLNSPIDEEITLSIANNQQSLVILDIS